jgi:hypothetical protein
MDDGRQGSTPLLRFQFIHCANKFLEPITSIICLCEGYFAARPSMSPQGPFSTEAAGLLCGHFRFAPKAYVRSS